VAATDNLGSVQIRVTADADLGEGIEPITGVLDLEIAGGKAESLGIIAVTPENRLFKFSRWGCSAQLSVWIQVDVHSAPALNVITSARIDSQTKRIQGWIYLCNKRGIHPYAATASLNTVSLVY
jgi:hypothetical protein